MRLIMSLCTALLIFMQSAHAESLTYTCTAAKNQARTAVHEGNAVTITADEDTQECRFSINGARVGSPPQTDIFSGFDAIITGEIEELLRDGQVERLTYAMLAASPEAFSPGWLTEVLYRNSSELEDCFYQSRERQFESQMIVRETDLICGFIVSSFDFQVETREAIGFDFGQVIQISGSFREPILVVAATDGNRAHFLFVPSEYRQGRPFLPPLR